MTTIAGYRRSQVTANGIARRHEHRSTFTAVGIGLFAAITVAVHLALPTAPLWMAAAVAAFPALLITDAGMAVADRWGWLPATASRIGGAHDDVIERIPGWAVAIDSVVGGGLFGWFGEPWYDHWRHIYTATPGWLLYATMITLFGLASAAGEAVIAQGFKLLRNWRSRSPALRT